ncbi:MAG TPA: hypothetical protein PKY56_08390 [Candidatus Kapabacteria bacterium]|nr:hypothetical protein [Candidatus Kapabacteria bacterium]
MWVIVGSSPAPTSSRFDRKVARNRLRHIQVTVTCYVKRRPCNKTTTRFDGLTFDICRKNGTYSGAYPPSFRA